MDFFIWSGLRCDEQKKNNSHTQCSVAIAVIMFAAVAAAVNEFNYCDDYIWIICLSDVFSHCTVINRLCVTGVTDRAWQAAREGWSWPVSCRVQLQTSTNWRWHRWHYLSPQGWHHSADTHRYTYTVTDTQCYYQTVSLWQGAAPAPSLPPKFYAVRNLLVIFFLFKNFCPKRKKNCVTELFLGEI